MDSLPKPTQSSETLDAVSSSNPRHFADRMEEFIKTTEDVEMIWKARKTIQKLIKFDTLFEDQILYVMRKEVKLMHALGPE